MAILPASAGDETDYVGLLSVLESLRTGDFSLGLPMTSTGLAGKVPDAFIDNDMVASIISAARRGGRR